MASVPNVDKQFTKVEDFLTYLEGLHWTSWRPKFITMHHTGMPTLNVWSGWQVRKPPVSDAQWCKNLASYYGNTMHWHACPHFFVTPAHICVLSPPTSRGVHAVEFNSSGWGMEVVGDFDREAFQGPIRDRAVDALAACHLAMGWSPSPYLKGVSGLHFHRDDSTTRKTCPGRKIMKPEVQNAVSQRMRTLQGLSPPEDEHPQEVAKQTGTAQWSGTVQGLTQGDTLNVRADASARAPVLRGLSNGAHVSVYAEALNGATAWLRIGDGEFVVAQYVKRDGLQGQ